MFLRKLNGSIDLGRSLKYYILKSHRPIGPRARRDMVTGRLRKTSEVEFSPEGSLTLPESASEESRIKTEFNTPKKEKTKHTQTREINVCRRSAGHSLVCVHKPNGTPWHSLVVSCGLLNANTALLTESYLPFTCPSAIFGTFLRDIIS